MKYHSEESVHYLVVVEIEEVISILNDRKRWKKTKRWYQKNRTFGDFWDGKNPQEDNWSIPHQAMQFAKPPNDDELEALVKLHFFDRPNNFVRVLGVTVVEVHTEVSCLERIKFEAVE